MADYDPNVSPALQKEPRTRLQAAYEACEEFRELHKAASAALQYVYLAYVEEVGAERESTAKIAVADFTRLRGALDKLDMIK